MRVQVYLTDPAVNVDIDEVRLARTAPWSNQVSPLTFVTFFEGDYDGGTSIYNDLNGLAGSPDDTVMQTWNALGPDGILVNQLAAPDHRMVGNVGWLAIDGNSLSYGGISQSGAVANLDAAYTKRYGSPPRAAPRASLPGATSTPGRPWPRR